MIAKKAIKVAQQALLSPQLWSDEVGDRRQLLRSEVAQNHIPAQLTFNPSQGQSDIPAMGYIDFIGAISTRVQFCCAWVKANYIPKYWPAIANVQFARGSTSSHVATMLPFFRADVGTKGIGLLILLELDQQVGTDLRAISFGDGQITVNLNLTPNAKLLEGLSLYDSALALVNLCSAGDARTKAVALISSNRTALLSTQLNSNIWDLLGAYKQFDDRVELEKRFIRCLLASRSVLINHKWIEWRFDLPNFATLSIDDQVLCIATRMESSDFTTTPLFDPVWYRKQAPASTGSGYFALLMHYLIEGEKVGLSPNAFWSPIVISSRDVDFRRRLMNGELKSCLEFFIEACSISSLAANLLFDEIHYVSTPTFDISILAGRGLDPYAHFVTIGWRSGFSANRFFDEEFYLRKYVDVADMVERGDIPNGFSHYIYCGEKQGRQCNAFFDPEAYLELNQDVKIAVVTGALSSAFWHFSHQGIVEGRRASHSQIGESVLFYLSDSFPNHEWTVIDGRCERVRCVPEEIARRLRFPGPWTDESGARRVTVRDALINAFETEEQPHNKQKARRTAASELETIFSWLGAPVVKFRNIERFPLYCGSIYTLYLAGEASAPFKELVAIHAECGRHSVKSRFVRLPRVDAFRQSLARHALTDTLLNGVMCAIEIDTTILAAGSHTLTVSFVFEGFASSIEFTADPVELTVLEKPDIGSGRLETQVCMATYNPSTTAFTNQLSSILDQDAAPLDLIISDDQSEYASLFQMNRVVKDLHRVKLVPSKLNVGFVANFERAIRLGSDVALFTLFSDQDDVWYQSKVQALLDAVMATGACCAFSDMRIVDAQSNEIAPSFWGDRKVHFKSASALSVANTVTGAAAVFTKELSALLIPFPRFMGLYHDQWLSVCAAAFGKVHYVDRPLYDYVQHGGNVLGYMGSRVIEDVKWKLISRTVAMLRRKTPSKWDSKDCECFLAAIGQVDGATSQRFVLLTEALHRIAIWSDSQDQAFSAHVCLLFEGKPTEGARFLYSHWRAIRAGAGGDKALIGIDYLLKSSLFALWMLRSNLGPITLRVRAHLAKNSAALRVHNRIWHDDERTDLERKTRQIAVTKIIAQRMRINILIPELRLASFFGGYHSKIALASRLIDSGHNVRIVLIDEPVVDYDEIFNICSAFPPLTDGLLKADIVAFGNREAPIDVGEKDVIVATTWWSASIANKIIQDLGRREFLYFIQEYEPFTFPMGTWYRAAEETYEHAHRAVFSTEMLRDHFRTERLGVFRKGRSGRQSHMTFRNPIVGSIVDVDKREEKSNLLLFYARPQPHAARNMFEFGIAALRSVVASLGEQAADWRFIGIGAGSVHNMALSQSINLELVNKLDHAAYAKLLKRAKVGVALMYTPHPSLIPIEMVSAGLETVTNSCLSKNADSFLGITDSIVVVPPSIEGIAYGVRLAMERANNHNIDHHAVTIWPETIEAAFPDKWIRQFIKLGQQSLVRPEPL